MIALLFSLRHYTLLLQVERKTELIMRLGFVLLSLAGFVWALRDYANLPTVYLSYPTRECVRVEQADGKLGDCSNLPDRYHYVWVE